MYNLLEPAAAGELGDRKVANVLATEPDAIVSANPGCLLQIRSGLDRAGRPVPLMHLVELLDASISGGSAGLPARTTPRRAGCAGRGPSGQDQGIEYGNGRRSPALRRAAGWEYRTTMTWTQTYTPLGGLGLSTLVAAMPVVVLLGLLGLFHVRAHWAALAGLAASLLIAVVVYRMPAGLAGRAAAYGAAFGLLPIGWIVLCAIFVYDITVYTGQFEIIKHTIAGLADDRRIQVLLIAFSFGAFIEGAAGFGTPVAISAAMLIGLGFRPLPAAGLALIGNTAPVAFGALGTPILTLRRSPACRCAT